MEINSREAVMEAVARGLGIGVFAETEVQPHRRLRVIRVSDAEMYVYAYLVCLSERLAQDGVPVDEMLAAFRRSRGLERALRTHLTERIGHRPG